MGHGKNEAPLDIGSRRELLLDDYLLAAMKGRAQFRLHHPVPREPALVTDRPWEGNQCGFISVFRDDEGYRMYYKAQKVMFRNGRREHPLPIFTCCALSDDGIAWRRPELGVVEFNGSKRNNIVWQSDAEGTVIPFKDPNPAAASDARYKAFLKANLPDRRHLHILKSADGLRWEYVREAPVITRGTSTRAFDSPNLAFWDPTHGEYRAYFREWSNNLRGIMTATSPDFVHWSDPVWVRYPGSLPRQQLYTSQVMPYPRASHILVGFPTRYVERRWSPAIAALPEPEHRRIRSGALERLGSALTDGLFMSSRDGVTFKRWDEAFIRPGPQLEGNWAYGDNYQCRGLIETPSDLEGAPPELTCFATEGYWRGDSVTFRRYTLRMDGFVSVNAPLSGGEIVTKPLRFKGDTLRVNSATSAAGQIQVELREPDGAAIPGYAFEDSVETIGDELDRAVAWRHGTDVGTLEGKPGPGSIAGNKIKRERT